MAALLRYGSCGSIVLVDDFSLSILVSQAQPVSVIECQPVSLSQTALFS